MGYHATVEEATGYSRETAGQAMMKKHVI